MDFGFLGGIRINRSAVEARAKQLATRRTFKKEAQVAAYLNIVRCLDLTTLKGDDTEGRTRQLCGKALNPVKRTTLESLELPALPLTVGAVCVYPAMVRAAVAAVGGQIPVASVATGFPAGQTGVDVGNGQADFSAKWREIELAIKAGAKEVDIVITRPLVLNGKFDELYRELAAIHRDFGEKAKIKTILGVGDLRTLENVAKASAVAIAASADGDFIKTSTGFEETNATLEAGIVMARQIRASGRRIGLKPAGGIRTGKDAMLWYSLMLEELGEAWCFPELFRIGANSAEDGLLADIGRQLDHLANDGRYSSFDYQPVG